MSPDRSPSGLAGYSRTDGLIQSAANRTDSAKGLGQRSNVRPRLVSMREAAQYLSVSYWTIRGWVESGKLRAVRLPGGGKLIRIELAELDRLVESCRDA